MVRLRLELLLYEVYSYNMKILVTGGAGFIGSHIVDSYINKGHEVFIIDNFSTGKRENLNPKANFSQIDIRDKEKISDFFQKVKPDLLNHHAAQLDVRKSVADPAYDAQVNILGLLNLIEAGRNNNLKKIVFSSSGGVVYGDAKTIPTPEDYQPLKPISPYGVAKLTSEHYLYYYYKVYGLPYIALRYANVYGPRQDPFGEAGVVAIFTQKLLKGENPVINGDGKQTRDYVFVKDVVQANINCLDSNYVGALNVGTAIETDINSIFNLLVKLTGCKAIEKHGPPKVGEQRRSALNNSLAQKILKWNLNFSLDEGMNQTVKFFKS